MLEKIAVILRVQFVQSQGLGKRVARSSKPPASNSSILFRFFRSSLMATPVFMMSGLLRISMSGPKFHNGKEPKDKCLICSG